LKDRIRDFLIIPLVAAITIIADQVTKHLVTTSLRLGESLELTPRLGA